MGKAVAIGIAVGSGYIYETTFEKEVFSDLYGERGCLMGGIQGMFKAQYVVLRAHGHSPSEAFNETCEEALESLYPLCAERHGLHVQGMLDDGAPWCAGLGARVRGGVQACV